MSKRDLRIDRAWMDLVSEPDFDKAKSRVDGFVADIEEKSRELSDLDHWKEYILSDTKLQNFEPLSNHVLVDADPDKNIFRLKGQNGENVDLFIPKSDELEQKRLNSVSGLVVKKPLTLDRLYKGYLDHVETADRVYFHFNSLSSSKELGFFAEDSRGEKYYAIPVDVLYCSVRDNVITPIGNTCFIDPVDQDEDEKKTTSGIFLPEINKYNPGKKTLEGIVSIIKPNNKLGLKPGDRIMYEQDSDFAMDIEGKVMYRMQIDDIIALL